jgi:ADP-ribose pyrophosphatase YjhB (NUDIX family)
MSSSSINLLQRIGRLAMPFYMVYCHITRGMTLGVRAAVFDTDNRIFLVKHTYIPGWHMPGGGIEANETAQGALIRELEEEGHIRLDGPAELNGFFWNSTGSTRRDHIAFFIVRQFTQTKPRLPDREIAEARFFPLDGLPEDTSQATLRRLAELAGERATDGNW